MVLFQGATVPGDREGDTYVVSGIRDAWVDVQQFRKGQYLGSFVKTRAAAEALFSSATQVSSPTVNPEAFGQTNLYQTSSPTVPTAAYQPFDITPEKVQSELAAYAAQNDFSAEETASLLKFESLPALQAAAAFRAENYALLGESAEAILGSRPDILPSGAQASTRTMRILPVAILAAFAFLVLRK